MGGAGGAADEERLLPANGALFDNAGRSWPRLANSTREPAVGRKQLFDISEEADLAPVEQQQVVTGALEFADQVRRKHDRHRTFGDLLHERAEEAPARERIEGRDWLVEQEESRTACQSHRQADLGALATRELPDTLPDGNPEAIHARPGCRSIPRVIHPAPQLEHFRHAEIAVERDVLGEEGDLSASSAAVLRIGSQHAHLSARRNGKAGGDIKQRRLAGSVLADDGNHPALGKCERALAQSPVPTESLAQ
jgi:hypothetical protein